MADREGDPTKQPPECKSVFTPHPDPRPPGAVGEGTWSKCPHIKETGGGMEGEQCSCEVCGKRYFLDYDDMR